jgi:hypothetical protein
METIGGAPERRGDDVNVESGDLKAWEYFIHTFDHGATMDDSENGGTTMTAAQTRQENNNHLAMTHPKQDLSESESEHHSLHPMLFPSVACTSGSSLTNNHWGFYPQLGNCSAHSTPSFGSDSAITDLSSMVNSQRSWSYPLLTNQMMHLVNKSAKTPSLHPLYAQMLESINEAALHHQHQFNPLLHDQNSAANISLFRANLDRYYHANCRHPESDINLLESSLEPNRIVSSAFASSTQGNNFVSSLTSDDCTTEAPKADTSNVQIPIFAQQIVPPYQERSNPRLLLKPLTSYNYYYRDERDNIVRYITHEEDSFPSPVSDFSPFKMDTLLYQHWYMDPVKQKRIHRKSHGKVSFEFLSKAISKRWHDLPQEGRAFYRNVSLTDSAYYHHHMKRIQQRFRSLNSTSST